LWEKGWDEGDSDNSARSLMIWLKEKDTELAAAFH